MWPVSSIDQLSPKPKKNLLEARTIIFFAQETFLLIGKKVVFLFSAVNDRGRCFKKLLINLKRCSASPSKAQKQWNRDGMSLSF